MTTRERVKVTMQHTGMDLWTLAKRARIGANVLDQYMLSSEATLPATDQGRVVHFMVTVGLCPECGGHLMQVGGCVECRCGWARC